MTTMREQVSLAMSGTQGHHGDVLDAVMAVVAGVERERDEARASVEHLRGDYRRLWKQRDRLRLAWRSARRRANQFRWLHAEAVWQRDEALAEVERVQQQCYSAESYREEATVERLLAERESRDVRESRFRWAEEAAALQAKLDLPCGSCHPCVNWDATAEPGDAEEALTAALEAHQSSIVTMDDAGPEFDAQYAARIALDLVRSWGPATAEAAPPPPCEKCRCRGVQDPDRPASVFGHFCLSCIGACHDMSDESSIHMCVIDRWTPSVAGVSGTGTEAAPLADIPEAEWREFHTDVTSARGTERGDLS